LTTAHKIDYRSPSAQKLRSQAQDAARLGVATAFVVRGPALSTDNTPRPLN
jgi:hypothetical protein